MGKLAIAAGRVPCALGAAQIPEVQERETGDVKAALRVVAQVSLGKRSILFRVGNLATERGEALDELALMMLTRPRRSGKFFRHRPLCREALRCIAAVALDELTADLCNACGGRGEMQVVGDAEGRQPMMPCYTCAGTGIHKPEEHERVVMLSREMVRQRCCTSEESVEHAIEQYGPVAFLMDEIDRARALILEAERVAVEETAKMLERWR